VALIPLYGYWASAWATLVVYALQMVASYYLGQKHYPINYNLRKFMLYIGLAVLLYLLLAWIDLDPGVFSWTKFLVHNAAIALYVWVIFKIERPFTQKLTKNRS
jgi:hypothetical protein